MASRFDNSQTSPHGISASTSTSDLKGVFQQLSPPSQLELQQHVLSHSLLSTRLPNSSVLAKEIEALQQQIDQNRINLQRSKEAVRRELLTSSEDLANLRQSLDTLPVDIEEVGDAIDGIARSLEDSNPSKTSEESLIVTLKKHQEAVISFRSARNYFAILSKAQHLWEAAQGSSASVGSATSVTGDPQLDSLAELAHLCSFADSLTISADADQAKKLRFLAFLRSKTSETYAILLDGRSKTLRDALAKADWPPLSAEQAQAQDKLARSAESILNDTDVRTSWSELTACQIVGALLKIAPPPSCLAEAFQRLERPASGSQDRSSPSHLPSPGDDRYVPLLTTAILVEPYLLRFRYHFDSSRSTNRLDKPEWYLNHMLDLIRSLLPVFASSSGAAVRLSATSLRRYGMRPDRLEQDLIHVLIVPLKMKVEASIPLLLAQGQSSQMFTHTVSALTSFDADLEGITAGSGASSDDRALRTVEAVLSKGDWFNRWIEGAKHDAEEALESFLDDANAWTISTPDSLDSAADDDDNNDRAAQQGANVPLRETKSTLSARSLVQLIQALTDTYTPLPLLSQRIHFLTLIQLPLLRSHAHRLTRSLEAFESLSSAFARAIPGGIETTSSGSLVNTESKMVSGIRGLNRLLKAYLSALHVKVEVEKWQDSSFFLDMSESLLTSEAGMKLLQATRAEAEWRDLDSESLGSLIRKGLRSGQQQDRSATLGKAPTSVWGEIIDRYEDILARSRAGIERLVVAEVVEGLKGYTHMHWLDSTSPLDEQGDESVSIPTPVLLPALSTLHSHLSHLLKSLPTKRCIPIYQSIASELAAQIVQRVVILGGSKRFTKAGAHRFLLDYEEGWLSILGQLQEQARPSASSSTRLRVELTGLGYIPSSAWQRLRDVTLLLSLPTTTSSMGDDHPQRWGDWTLSRAVGVLFEEDALGRGVGEETLRRDLKLTSWDELGRDRLREILRRRVDCGR